MPDRLRKVPDIVTCAGKIHFDQARGFIEAEWSAKRLNEGFGLAGGPLPGLVRLINRDYTIQEGVS